jgi:hypothetical protein
MTSADPNQPPSASDTYNVYIGGQKRSLEGLLENLPPLPATTHPFRDHRHDQWRALLEHERILILSSHEGAAQAAAYSLAQDDQFSGKARRAFFPGKGELKDRSDLDIFAVADEQFLGESSEVLLVGIDQKCILLESILITHGPMAIGLIQSKLEKHGSHVILVVKQDLLGSLVTKPNIAWFRVSHIRYLLEHYIPDRAEELERRVLAAVPFAADSVEEMRELNVLVEDRLTAGVEAFENFLAELERTHKLPGRGGSLAVSPGALFRDDSEMHRAATFVATYFPDIGQRDFGRLVLTLLADQARPVEQSRQVVGPDGTVVQESWSDRWMRDADRLFRECHLRRIMSPAGAWIVDFDAPHLRRELRAFLEEDNPWYVDQQCQILQRRGVLFALDLSTTAVEALVRLFVERAVIEPGGFDLPEMVQTLRIQLRGTPPGESQDEILAWLFEQATLEAQLRAHFYSRLALLIREMLDREPLRRMVRDFFEYLIAARQHQAVLGVILDLARRLRFAPHFDPLYWMRRLLDQGNAVVKERTEMRLINLARDSGPRIYEYLAVIRTWLPDADRTADRFSISNRVALAFPFRYCQAVAALLPQEQYGRWPSHHPLFYALPADAGAARTEIGSLVEWILDARGEENDESDEATNAEATRMAQVADLVEHWAAVLEGTLNDGQAEGRALFRAIFEEMNSRLGVSQRMALRQSWQRRQDFYVAHAATSQPAQRTLLINLRARLEQLLRRFSTVP